MLAVDVLKSYITKENIEVILHEYGVRTITQHGDTLRCACPIHQSKNESTFMWKLSNNSWCCYKERIGGDIYHFIAHMEDLDLKKDFHIIVQKIADKLGVDIKGLEIGEIDLKQRKDTNDWLSYVLNNKKENAKEFNINTLGELKQIKRYRMLDSDVLTSHNIMYSVDLNRICFPIYDEQNNMIGASCRANGNMKPKWMHFPKGIFTGLILYNLAFCVDNGFREVYIVEGILDVLNLERIGVYNVVCVFGDKITPEQGKLLMKHFDTLILAFDNDDAGHIAINKSIATYKDIFNLKVLCLKHVKDVGAIETLEEFEQIEQKAWWKYGV